MKRACLLALALLVLTPAGAESGLYDEYRQLTRAEKWLALRYFWQLPAVRGAAERARQESAVAYPRLPGQDDPRDAFRHSLWNGLMTRRLESVAAAERWGSAHEDFPGNPAARRAMDLENNRRGREAVWSARTTSGPWWWRRTRFPDEAAIGATLRGLVGSGGLVMIEEVGGQRDPDRGRLVPTRAP